MASEKKPTHVYLLYEQKILKDFSSDNQYMKEEKPKIRQAIRDIECLAKRDYNLEVGRIELRNIEIDGNKFEACSVEAIRETLEPYVNNGKKHGKNAKYILNVSAGGTKLILNLLLYSIWAEMEVHVTPQNNRDFVLPLPRMVIRDFKPSEKNLLLFIGQQSGEWVSRREIYDGCKYYEGVCGLLKETGEYFSGKMGEANQDILQHCQLYTKLTRDIVAQSVAIDSLPDGDSTKEKEKKKLARMMKKRDNMECKHECGCPAVYDTAKTYVSKDMDKLKTVSPDGSQLIEDVKDGKEKKCRLTKTGEYAYTMLMLEEEGK